MTLIEQINTVTSRFTYHGVVGCGEIMTKSGYESFIDIYNLKEKWKSINVPRSFYGLYLVNFKHISVDEYLKLREMFLSNDKEMHNMCMVLQDAIFERVKQEYVSRGEIQED